MKIRTLIVDDEELARERLRQLLKNEPEIELVGECAEGREALRVIHEKSPELIFLDIQIPELNGFDVLEAINLEPMPVIVFVTAHDQFALRAFEVHAVDYLLKPFDRGRFQTALRHAVDHVKNREASLHPERQAALLADLNASKPIERLAVKSSGRVILLKLPDIAWIQSAHNYVELHTDNGAYLHRETLSALEARLPADEFIRISRSVIVSLDRVEELEPLFSGEYAVKLRNGTKLTLSRRYRHVLPRLGLAK